MNRAIGIAVIMLAISLAGIAAITVIIPIPVLAKQCWLIPGSGGFPCYDNRHDCEQHLPPGAVVDCFRSRR